jgi:hypothetical protein
MIHMGMAIVVRDESRGSNGGKGWDDGVGASGPGNGGDSQGTMWLPVSAIRYDAR